MSGIVIKKGSTDEDVKFVVESWLSSYRTSHYSSWLSKQRYFDAHKAFLYEEVLQRPGVEVWMAKVDGESPPYDVIGWVVLEKPPGELPVVHYAYVKQPSRREGVAKAILKAAGVDVRSRFTYTCRTTTAYDIIKAKRLDAKFDPWSIREDRNNRRDR